MNGFDPLFAERLAERARQVREYQRACEFGKTAHTQKVEKASSVAVSGRMRHYHRVIQTLRRPGRGQGAETPRPTPADRPMRG